MLLDFKKEGGKSWYICVIQFILTYVYERRRREVENTLRLHGKRLEATTESDVWYLCYSVRIHPYIDDISANATPERLKLLTILYSHLFLVHILTSREISQTNTDFHEVFYEECNKRSTPARPVLSNAQISTFSNLSQTLFTAVPVLFLCGKVGPGLI